MILGQPGFLPNGLPNLDPAFGARFGLAPKGAISNLTEQLQRGMFYGGVPELAASFPSPQGNGFFDVGNAGRVLSSVGDIFSSSAGASPLFGAEQYYGDEQYGADRYYDRGYEDNDRGSGRGKMLVLGALGGFLLSRILRNRNQA